MIIRAKTEQLLAVPIMTDCANFFSELHIDKQLNNPSINNFIIGSVGPESYSQDAGGRKCACYL